MQTTSDKNSGQKSFYKGKKSGKIVVAIINIKIEAQADVLRR
jgi:hypothetical protein